MWVSGGLRCAPEGLPDQPCLDPVSCPRAHGGLFPVTLNPTGVWVAAVQTSAEAPPAPGGCFLLPVPPQGLCGDSCTAGDGHAGHWREARPHIFAQ